MIDAGMGPSAVIRSINHEYPSTEHPFDGDDLAILLDQPDKAEA